MSGVKRISMIVTAILVVAGAVSSWRPVAAQATRSDDVLPALLVEVKGLRAAMEQMAARGPASAAVRRPPAAAGRPYRRDGPPARYGPRQLWRRASARCDQLKGAHEDVRIAASQECAAAAARGG